MVLVDGDSGGWASKAIAERGYRAKRREEVGRRQAENVLTPSLVPNYEGQDTGTWREAQEEARKAGGDAAAETYDPLVSKEMAQ
jgi:hypothetical protein